MAQNLGSAFGKIFRIDPLGTNSATASTASLPATRSSTTAGRAPRDLRLRRAQPAALRLGLAQNGNLFLADIGQNIVEEISLVTAGANLGWNDWEGSYRFISRQAVSLENQRSDPKVTYPDRRVRASSIRCCRRSSAVTGVIVYRGTQIPQLANLVLFADMPSGEIFYVSADKLPKGGQDPIRRILLNRDGTAKTLLQ